MTTTLTGIFGVHEPAYSFTTYGTAHRVAFVTTIISLFVDELLAYTDLIKYTQWAVRTINGMNRTSADFGHRAYCAKVRSRSRLHQATY